MGNIFNKRKKTAQALVSVKRDGNTVCDMIALWDVEGEQCPEDRY